MPGLDDQFLDRENFYLAFKKVSFFLKQSNEWYDPIELAEYEATLSFRINNLINLLRNKEYRPKPIQPLPFPKKSAPNKVKRIRPYYNIHLDDQLIWMAITNVISELVDSKMPYWSYGNRLYRPIWYEKDPLTGKNILKKGSCRNTSANTYRKWNQSWPLYKRHISLTIKTMFRASKFKKDDIEDEKELKIYEQAEAENFSDAGYLDSNFWQQPKTKKLYWAGLDFEKFFPSIDPKKIIENTKICLVKDDHTSRNDFSLIIETMEKMLAFDLDVNGWDIKELKSKNSFSLIDVGIYKGLPTGLVCGGFLANLAMLDIDIVIQGYLDNNRDVAVFKYVDDHIILSQSKTSLITFLNFYLENIKNKNPKIRFQASKIEPQNALRLTEEKGFELVKIHTKQLELEPDFPSPLMTNTLKKVSHFNTLDFDLLDKEDLNNVEIDLKHFLLTEFPTAEIRKDTKMSFAAGKLSRLAVEIRPDFNKIDPLANRNIEAVKQLFKDSMANIKKTPRDATKLDKLKADLKNKVSLEFASRALPSEISRVKKRHENIFKLLIKALIENPDKIKLWKRSIEFCYLTGYEGLRDVLKTIQICQIHRRSKSYLKAYCLLNIQINMERAFVELNKSDILFWRLYCLSKFINQGVGINSNQSFWRGGQYDFFDITIKNYNSVKSFILMEFDQYSKLEAIPLPNVGKKLRKSFDFELRKAILTNNYLEPNDRLIWYFVSKFNWQKKHLFFENQVPSLNLGERISWSILSLFPALIPNETIRKVLKFIPLEDDETKLPFSDIGNLTRSNGFTYEMLYKKWREEAKVFDEFIHYYKGIEKILIRDNTTHIGLDEWISIVNEENSREQWLDPRLTEWTAIEIIKQISHLIIEGFNETKNQWGYERYKFYQIHASNYRVPIQWLKVGEIGWSEWESLMNQYPIMLLPKDDLLDDHRYFPIHEAWKTHIIVFGGNTEIPLIIGLAVLTLKLCTHNFIWPPSANKTSFIDEFYSQAYSSIENHALSSDLRMLLRAIFSKTSIDIFYENESIKLGNDDESIASLSDFIRYLTSTQAKLIKAQRNIINKEPRQLIYVNIDELNSFHNFL